MSQLVGGGDSIAGWDGKDAQKFDQENGHPQRSAVNIDGGSKEYNGEQNSSFSPGEGLLMN